MPTSGNAATPGAICFDAMAVEVDDDSVPIVHQTRRQCGTLGCELSAEHREVCSSLQVSRPRKRRLPTTWAADPMEGSEEEEAAVSGGASRREAPARRQRAVGSTCEHKRQRSRCKECGGIGICEHGRVHSRCKECGGSGICEHGRQRSQCKECGTT